MATFSNQVLVSSAGVMTLTPGVPLAFSVHWGANISPLRWSRLSAGVVSPGDADVEHSVAFVSEGTGWRLAEPGRTVIYATLRGEAQLAGPVQVRLQVLASQDDTF